MKNFLKANIFFLILLLIGIGLLAGAYFTNKSNKEFEKHSDTTVAVITKIDRSGGSKKAFVDYVIDGKEYKDIRLNYYSQSMDIGDTLTVTYDIDNPSYIEGEGSFQMAAYIMMILGIAFCFFGIFLFVIFRKE